MKGGTGCLEGAHESDRLQQKILSLYTEENEAVQMNASFLFHRDRLAKVDYWDWAAQKRRVFFFYWNHNSFSLFSHSSFLGNKVPLSYGSHR